MTSIVEAVGAGAALAAGTFAIRLSGPSLASRLHLTDRRRYMLDAASIVVLCAVMADTALVDGHSFTDPARPIGVGVAILLVRRRTQFPLVVAAATATTATIRLLGG